MDLLTLIKERIQKEGPLSFRDFMEMALYHPQYGYYSRSPQEIFGSGGDFRTSPEIHPVFGQVLARSASEIFAQMGPGPYTIVEMGGGSGALAESLFRALRESSPEIYKETSYLLVERSEAMRAAQKKRLAANEGEGEGERKVFFWERLKDLGRGNLRGVILSNEFLDALPFHRVKRLRGALREIYVDLRGGEIVETLGDLTTPEIDLSVLRHLTGLPEGWEAEVNLEAEQWMAEAARSLSCGAVITVDYGRPAHSFRRAGRCGTWRCFFKNTLDTKPYEKIGLKDITADVNFTAQALVARENGFELTGFTSQSAFLVNGGMQEILKASSATTKEQGLLDVNNKLGLRMLIHPEALGEAFWVLIQHKGMKAPSLSGLTVNRKDELFKGLEEMAYAEGSRRDMWGSS